MKARSGRGWAYLGAILGGGMSIAANIAHSYVPPAGAPDGWSPARGAVVGAIFWPTALLVAVEIFARVAWAPGRRWVALKFLGLLPVALVAAVVSYRHMSGLLAFYGEDWLTVIIGPMAVDGLMVMATGALISTSRPRSIDLVDDMHESDEPTLNPAVLAAAAANAALAAALAPSANLAGSEPGEPVTVSSDTPTRGRRARKQPPTAADKVARAARKKPDGTVAQIAALADVSESTARRHLGAMLTPPNEPGEPVTEPTVQTINGREPVLAGVSEGAQQ